MWEDIIRMVPITQAPVPTNTRRRSAECLLRAVGVVPCTELDDKWVKELSSASYTGSPLCSELCLRCLLCLYTSSTPGHQNLFRTGWSCLLYCVCDCLLLLLPSTSPTQRVSTRLLHRVTSVCDVSLGKGWGAWWQLRPYIIHIFRLIIFTIWHNKGVTLCVILTSILLGTHDSEYADVHFVNSLRE